MPISPDADYCLQGAVSLLEMTPDVYHGAYVAPLDVNAIVDACDDVRFGFADGVEQAFLAWYPQASDEKQAYAVVHGALDLRLQFDEARQSIINTLARIELRERGISEDASFLPAQSLPDIHIGDSVADAIDGTIQYFRLDQWAVKLRAQIDRLHAFVAERDLQHVLQLADRANVRYEPDVPAEITDRSRDRRKERQEMRRVRRAINRGIRTFDRIVGPDIIRAFISKKAVLVQGCRYNYLLRNNNNIRNHTRRLSHGIPFGMRLLNKSGDELASGCVYIAQTPVLDQLLALVLSVRDEESEVELIRVCNWNKLPKFREDAFLASLFPKNSPRHEVISPDARWDVMRGYAAHLDRITQQFSVYSDMIDRRIADFAGLSALPIPSLIPAA